MKKLASLTLALLLALGLVSSAFAATFVDSAENPGDDITDHLPEWVTTSKNIRIYVNNSAYADEIVVHPVSVLSSMKYLGNLNEVSQNKIAQILTASLEEMTSKSLYELTNRDSRFDRDDLVVCALFDVCYADKETQQLFNKDTYPVASKGSIDITFTNIQETIVAVLHGDDNGLNWKPMRFVQDSAPGDVTVYGFEDFSPVAFITVVKGSHSTEPILPGGSGGGGHHGGGGGSSTIPTSPQTGEMSYAWIMCSCGAALLTVSAFVRRRSAG